jgi:uncharacterized membrane protein
VANAEGRILLLGVAVALAYVLWLAVKGYRSPEEAQILIGVTATAALFGRAAGLAFGYSLELGHGTVIPIAMVVETVFVLVFYPLFVLSWRRLLVLKLLKRTFDRIHKAAETHRGTIQKYGIIGLFVFVWFPFWMTGPVVGCVIGFLLGLRAWVNLTIVLTGTYVAILSWALCLRRVHGRVAAYSSDAPMILVALLIVVIVVGGLLHRIVQRNRRRKDQ